MTLHSVSTDTDTVDARCSVNLDINSVTCIVDARCRVRMHISTVSYTFFVQCSVTQHIISTVTNTVGKRLERQIRILLPLI